MWLITSDELIRFNFFRSQWNSSFSPVLSRWISSCLWSSLSVTRTSKMKKKNLKAWKGCALLRWKKEPIIRHLLPRRRYRSYQLLRHVRALNEENMINNLDFVLPFLGGYYYVKSNIPIWLEIVFSKLACDPSSCSIVLYVHCKITIFTYSVGKEI